MIKKNKYPNFSIIIPNYNGAKFLPKCLNSIKKAIQKCSNSKFEIIIIDNGSSDNSIVITQKIFKNFKEKNLKSKIINLKSNTGFANAVNIGINQSQYNFVIPCNNDLILDPNWFKTISQSIQKNQNPKIVTFFGTILTKDGAKYESTGLEFFIQGKAKNILNGQSFNKNLLSKTNKLVWGTSAALVVYKKNIIQQIGLFDDDFFAYEEDVDLALRFHNLGFKTLYIPTAICYHLGGGTSNSMGNFRQRMDTKNWIYIIIKNYSAKEFWFNFPIIIIERLRNLSYLIKSTQKKYLLPIDLIKTYGEVLIKFPKMIKKRHQIKKLIKSINL